MTRARIAAERMMRSYFKSRGESWPEDDANEYLARLDITRIEKSGLNDRQRSVMDDIIRRSYFDVDDLIENHLEITVWIDDLSEFDTLAGARVYGHARPDMNVIALCERVDYEPLRRTTLMHETGHMLLHGSKLARALCYSPNAKTRPPEEKDADEFMVSALIPTATLMIAVVRAADHGQMSIVEALTNANTKRGCWQWRRNHFPFLINRLCVSRQMLGLALQRRRIFNRATYDHHLTYCLDTVWSVNHKTRSLGNIGRYAQAELDTMKPRA